MIVDLTRQGRAWRSSQTHKRKDEDSFKVGTAVKLRGDPVSRFAAVGGGGRVIMMCDTCGTATKGGWLASTRKPAAKKKPTCDSRSDDTSGVFEGSGLSSYKCALFALRVYTLVLHG